MERLARLLPFRQFGRLRHLRGLAGCAAKNTRMSGAAQSGSLFDSLSDTEPGSEVGSTAGPAVGLAAGLVELPPLPSAQPAFARVSLNSALNHTEPGRRAPVRVYHGPSRLIMVGTVDAVCRMIDRCIAEQHADLPSALAK
ncbi:MAG: hypothetical protein EPN70_19365 [Paraburkholderia sp.]|uniref:hypothetical protein n=1 Tax=Paraburkholderia sp. TaxID=1926495 RepID=UPI0012055B1B|nr:hypothetical protein [Paraburkholderia sp.]TAM01495.1 MAG: hypothetical protein EPN70_19365 [Paraburkholderia sp.]TAM31257.1 MAG: hypothetical protein EPN59_06100 [Paraburkholderia sp.]